MMERPPLWARSAMSLSQALAGVGPSVLSLDEQDLRKQAMKATGLEDWGDDDHREGLELVLRSMREDAELSFIGRFMARTHVLNALKVRLQAVDTMKRRPELLEQAPRRPIIIASFPRTGSTLLVNLLAAHPDAMSLPLWLALRPLPPPDGPEWARGGNPERRIIAERTARQAEQFMPNMKYIQPFTPEGRVECTFLMSPTFRSEKWWTNFPTRTYIRWLIDADMSRAYAYYRQLLQLLQADMPGTFWALKAPSHVPWIRPLMEAVPEALVVHLHRDPAACVPSLASQLHMIQQLTSTKPDPEHIGDVIFEVFAKGARRMVAAHRDVGDERILAIEFNDLVGDPMGWAERVCRRADVRWDDEVAQALQAHLDSKEKRPKHHYSPEDVGLTREGIHEAFAEHIDYFGTVLDRS